MSQVGRAEVAGYTTTYVNRSSEICRPQLPAQPPAPAPSPPTPQPNSVQTSPAPSPASPAPPPCPAPSQTQNKTLLAPSQAPAQPPAPHRPPHPHPQPHPNPKPHPQPAFAQNVVSPSPSPSPAQLSPPAPAQASPAPPPCPAPSPRFKMWFQKQTTQNFRSKALVAVDHSKGHIFGRDTMLPFSNKLLSRAQPQPSRPSQPQPQPQLSPGQSSPAQPLHPAQHPAPDSKCGSKKKKLTKTFGRSKLWHPRYEQFL